MGFNFLFDKIEPTGFGLNSMALTETVGKIKKLLIPIQTVQVRKGFFKSFYNR